MTNLRIFSTDFTGNERVAGVNQVLTASYVPQLEFFETQANSTSTIHQIWKSACYTIPLEESLKNSITEAGQGRTELGGKTFQFMVYDEKSNVIERKYWSSKIQYYPVTISENLSQIKHSTSINVNMIGQYLLASIPEAVQVNAYAIDVGYRVTTRGEEVYWYGNEAKPLMGFLKTKTDGIFIQLFCSPFPPPFYKDGLPIGSDPAVAVLAHDAEHWRALGLIVMSDYYDMLIKLDRSPQFLAKAAALLINSNIAFSSSVFNVFSDPEDKKEEYENGTDEIPEWFESTSKLKNRPHLSNPFVERFNQRFE